MDDSDEPPRQMPPGWDVAAELKALGAIYSDRRNPVYVWQALAIQYDERLRQRLRRQEQAPLVVPEWAESYLLEAAHMLMRLANGLVVKPHPTEEGTARILHMKNEALKEKVPAALSLVSPGRNAFKDYQADCDDARSAKRHQNLVAKGLTFQQALDQLTDGAGKDQSVVRKGITKGKRLLQMTRDAAGLGERRKPTN